MATCSLNLSNVFSFEPSGGKDENLDRLFKNFTYKCLQVIVQSRLESHTVQSTKDSSTSDFFCISIPENPHVEEQIKKTLEGIKKPFPVRDQSVCTEIYLVTNDGDHMFLETWELSFNTSSRDMSANRIQHMFTRMGVTLKSLLSATRAMPAYRLAKNQGKKEGGYILKYRFYLGKPQTHLLGEGFRVVNAGSVPTAFGLLSVSASFRTQLLLSSETSVSAAGVIEVTDNYFVNDCRAAAAMPDPEPCLPIDISPVRPESPYCFAVSPSSLEREDTEMAGRVTTDRERVVQSSIFALKEFPEPIIGAFSVQKPAIHRKVDHGVPFESLMRRSLMARQIASAQLNNGDGGSDVDGDPCDKRRILKQQDIADDEKENNLASSLDFVGEQMTLEDDYVMVDKPPFAVDDDPRDAKSFLSAMYRAADLYDLPDSKVSVADYLSNVEALVFKLEGDMPELDDFCQSLISANSREDEEDIPLFS